MRGFVGRRVAEARRGNEENEIEPQVHGVTETWWEIEKKQYPSRIHPPPFSRPSLASVSLRPIVPVRRYRAWKWRCSGQAHRCRRSARTLGMLVTAPGCAPLLIDTCGGFELARRLASIGHPLKDIRNVIATHRHMDHTGGFPALFLANMPLDIYAIADTHAGIDELVAAGYPEWPPHAEVTRTTRQPHREP